MTNLADYLKRDHDDPLRHKRAAFALPAKTIYLDGNSLGPLPWLAQQRAQQVITEQWGHDLITSWNQHGWIHLPQKAGEKIARLIGAAPGQVTVADSISVNLFKLLGTALSLQSGRNTILSVRQNFPTDLYMAQGLETLLGRQRCTLKLVDEELLEQSLGQDVAVLMLTHVDFRTGRVHDMHRLTQLAQQQGILVLWDLAHSAGALPLALDEANVDFAVGCGYKYLNGGPGAPAFVYVASRHQAHAQQPLSGWMGHQAPFEFDPTYTPAADIRQFLCGTPSVVAMSMLDAALSVFDDVSMEQIRHKSLALSDCFLERINANPALASLKLISPVKHHLRGSQLAFSHPDSFAISQALIAHNVIPDFRAPDILRFGFCPLFNTFEDIWQAVEVLANIVSDKVYLEEQFQVRHQVT